MMADPITVWSSLLTSPEAPKSGMPPLELDGYLTGIVVTPQAAPIRPSAWVARVGDDEPIFANEVQINTVLAAVMIRYYNTLHAANGCLT